MPFLKNLILQVWRTSSASISQGPKAASVQRSAARTEARARVELRKAAALTRLPGATVALSSRPLLLPCRGRSATSRPCHVQQPPQSCTDSWPSRAHVQHLLFETAFIYQQDQSLG